MDRRMYQGPKPVKEIKLRLIDPCTNSLDDIIDEVVKNDDLGLITVELPGRRRCDSRLGSRLETIKELEEPRYMESRVGTIRPLQQIKLRPIDPRIHTLQEMIEVVEEDTPKPRVMVSQVYDNHIPHLKQGHKRSAEEIDEPGGMDQMGVGSGAMTVANHPRREYGMLTPYRAIGLLTKQGLIEVKVGKLEHVDGDRSHLWRSIITCGGIKGIADSVRKVVAREMASVQFLTQLGATYKEVKIPKYEVINEMLLDPQLFVKVKKAAAERGIESAVKVGVKPLVNQDVGRKPSYVYVSTYFIGPKKFEGQHLIAEYAKLLAAHNAYIDLTGRVPPPITYFTGEACEQAFPNSAYYFSETEVLQSVAQIETDGNGAIPNDPDKAEIAMTRHELYDNFKRAKRDEVDRIRNMPVDVNPFRRHGTWKMDNKVKVDSVVSKEDGSMKGGDGSIELEERTGKRTGRGRGQYLAKMRQGRIGE